MRVLTGTMGLLPRKAAMVSVYEHDGDKPRSLFRLDYGEWLRMKQPRIIVDVVIEADGEVNDRIIVPGSGAVL